MKKTFTILTTLFLSFTSLAQECAEFEWAVKAGGSDYADYGNNIAIDASGNTYVVGTFRGNATFGTTTLWASNTDGFVAKLNPQGQYLWAVKTGGSTFGASYGIAVDASGNSYVTGFFQGTATFGDTTLTSSGSSDIFIAKLNSQGQYVWAVKAGGSSGDEGLDITVDEIGNSYVTGVFAGTSYFGPTSLISSGGRDVFIAKIDSQGHYLWAVKAGGNSDDYGSNIATDALGNSFVIGSFKGDASFGLTDLTSLSESREIFISKLTPQGVFEWAVKGGGSGNNENGNHIAVDDSGNSYIRGSVYETTTFGSTTLTGGGSFVAKLNPQGQYVWAVKAEVGSGSRGNGIAIDISGNSYITGFVSGITTFGSTTLTGNGAFISKLSPQGQYVWAIKTGGSSGSGSCTGNGIVVDASENIYLTGVFNGTGNFGTTTLSSNPLYNNDIFIAKLNPINGPSINSVFSSHTIISCGSTTQLQVEASSSISNLFYSWFPENSLTGANTATPTTTQLTSTTTYTVLVTTPSCSATDSVTIEVIPSFTVNALASQTSIECGSSTFLNAQLPTPISGATYLWKNDQGQTIATTQSVPNISPRSTTTYTVTVTSPNGCSFRDSVKIEVLNNNTPPLNISVSRPYVCENNTTTLGVGSVTNILWNTGATTSSITATTPGTYSVTANMNSGQYSGCLAQGSVTLEPFATISSNGTTLCGSQPLELAASVYGNPGSIGYFWNTGATTQNISVSTSGTYSCQVVTTNCTYTASVTVTTSTGTYTPQVFAKETNALTATFTNTDANAVSYSWDFGDGNTSTDEHPTHVYASAGTYTVCLTATDFCGTTGQVCDVMVVESSVDIEEAWTTKFVKLFPNPAVNEVVITSEIPLGLIELKDLNGKVIYSSAVNDPHTTIDISRLSMGVYIIEVSNSEKKYIERMVKR